MRSGLHVVVVFLLKDIIVQLVDKRFIELKYDVHYDKCNLPFIKTKGSICMHAKTIENKEAGALTTMFSPCLHNDVKS